MLIERSIAGDTQAVKMSLMKGWKFQCINTTCSPITNIVVANILSCQTACLTEIQCKAASFYRSTRNCQLFADIFNRTGNMLSDIDVVTMIVIEGTRFPP
ncbi:unnamed protein product, partial [Adineta steineri]